MHTLLAGLLALQLLAVPPLSHEQQAQLETAKDNIASLDEGALYPLLLNAMDWPPGDEAGAMVPDYQAILENPADARGRLYLVEGAFYRARSVRNLARPGPWDPMLQEWSISPDGKGEQFVVVYMVHGQPENELPRIRQQVRLAGRFYKVWLSKDYNQELKPYLVFVGQSARIIRPTGGSAGLGSNMPSPTWIAVFVLAVSFAVVSLWRFLNNRELARERRSRLEPIPEPEPQAVEEEDNEPPLPDDPVKAMEEMERRRKAQPNEP